MRFVNKFSLTMFLLIGFLLRFLFPEELRLLYFSTFLAVTAFILGVLIYKYKCINLVAGIESNKGNIEIVSKYVGRLMFLIGIVLGVATVFSIFNEKLFSSWYMIFFAGPIVLYALFCLIKINKP